METRKRCPRCGLTKVLSQFNWRDAAHTKPQSYCRECSNKAWREWYGKESNRQHHLMVLKARRQRRIQRHQELVRDLKSQPCADCGKEFPPYMLDFDHVMEKTGEVSILMYTHGTDRLLTELKRCELVCANCHRRRTFRRLGKSDGSSPDPV